jgi:metallo-beta-lactamase class B
MFIRSLIAFTMLAVPLSVGAAPQDPSWTEPVSPFRIADRLYYVGSRELAVYLIDSGDGLVLLDGGVPENAPQVLASIRSLGFDPRRVRLLLNSQAHFDHAGALAEIKAKTGARLLASAADASLLERGGRGDFAWGDDLPYPQVKVDRVVRNGEKVRLGKVSLTARITPGHTKGCTTWQMPIADSGRRYDVLFLCGTTAPGYQLTDNRNYPNIVGDFRRSFATWKGLPCDFFLGAHASYFAMERKRAALGPSGANPFIDPAGCRDFIARSEQAFEKQLSEEQAKRSK